MFRTSRELLLRSLAVGSLFLYDCFLSGASVAAGSRPVTSPAANQRARCNTRVHVSSSGVLKSLEFPDLPFVFRHPIKISPAASVCPEQLDTSQIK